MLINLVRTKSGKKYLKLINSDEEERIRLSDAAYSKVKAFMYRTKEYGQKHSRMLYVLHAIKEHTQLTTKELSQQVGIDKKFMDDILEELIKYDFIKKTNGGRWIAVQPKLKRKKE